MDDRGWFGTWQFGHGGMTHGGTGTYAVDSVLGTTTSGALIGVVHRAADDPATPCLAILDPDKDFAPRGTLCRSDLDSAMQRFSPASGTLLVKGDGVLRAYRLVAVKLPYGAGLGSVVRG